MHALKTERIPVLRGFFYFYTVFLDLGDSKGNNYKWDGIENR